VRVSAYPSGETAELRPAGLKTDMVEVSLLPTFSMGEEQRKRGVPADHLRYESAATKTSIGRG
jgi:hypothetical protein